MSISAIFTVIKGISSIASTIFNYASTSKEVDPTDEMLQEMLAILNKLQQGQADILAMLDLLLSTTEWRSHEEIIFDAVQNINHRYGQLIDFGSNPEFDTEEGRTAWANTCVDEMSHALSDIDHAIRGTTSPTLDPLLTEFKDYFLSRKQSEGYAFKADQQVVLRYMLFLLNKQSQAFSVYFNARDLLGLGHDDLDPEGVMTSQYTLVENDVLKGLTSIWQTASKDRPSNFCPLWPAGSACPIANIAIGERTCSPGKVVIGVRFMVYGDKIGGLELCEATVGPLGIPTEAGTWIEANKSVLEYHSSSTNGCHYNAFKYDNTVDVGDAVEVLTGIHIAWDNPTRYFYTRAHFTQMNVATGELVAGTERWETQPCDYDKTSFDWETLNGLPSVDGVSCITGLMVADGSDTYRIHALKTLRVADTNQ